MDHAMTSSIRTIRVAAAQMRARPRMADSARVVVGMVDGAARRGAKFLVTPEMILTGYHERFDQAERDRLIDHLIRPACARARLCLQLGAGSYRDAGGRPVRKPRIQVTIIAADGAIVGYHDKLIPTGGDLKWCSRGNPARLRTFRSGGLTFGSTICNDFWATPVYTTLPDLKLPMRLARLGARAILHSIASGWGPTYLDFHTSRMEERARIGGVWVVSANAVHGPHAVDAPTGILDPRGRWVARAPRTGERLLVGTIRV